MNPFREIWETLRIELKGLVCREAPLMTSISPIHGFRFRPRIWAVIPFVEITTKSLDVTPEISKGAAGGVELSSVVSIPLQLEVESNAYDLLDKCETSTLRMEDDTITVSMMESPRGFKSRKIEFPRTMESKSWTKEMRTCVDPTRFPDLHSVWTVLRVLRLSHSKSEIRTIGVYRGIPEGASDFTRIGRKLCFKHRLGSSSFQDLMVFEERTPSGETKLLMVKMKTGERG